MSQSTEAKRRRWSAGRYPVLIALMLFIIAGYAAVLVRLD